MLRNAKYANLATEGGKANRGYPRDFITGANALNGHSHPCGMALL